VERCAGELAAFEVEAIAAELRSEAEETAPQQLRAVDE